MVRIKSLLHFNYYIRPYADPSWMDCNRAHGIEAEAAFESCRALINQIDA
jgi:hypothetical protein